MQMLLYNLMFNKMSSTEKFQTVNEQNEVRMIHLSCPVGQPVSSLKMIFTHKGQAVAQASVDKLYPFTKLVVSFQQPISFDGIYIKAAPIYLHQVIEYISSATNITFEKEAFQVQATPQTSKDNELVGQYSAIKVQREKAQKNKQAEDAEKEQQQQQAQVRRAKAKQEQQEAKAKQEQKQEDSEVIEPPVEQVEIKEEPKEEPKAEAKEEPKEESVIEPVASQDAAIKESENNKQEIVESQPVANELQDTEQQANKKKNKKALN